MNVKANVMNPTMLLLFTAVAASIVALPVRADPLPAEDESELEPVSSLKLELWSGAGSSDVRLAAFQDDRGPEPSDADQRPEGDNTGTDPRDFANKFMPYYRYTKLKNDIEVQELTLFGLFAFDPRFAMTYELPVAKYLDYSDFGPFQAGMGIPPGNGNPPSGGVPFADLDPDGDEVGMGDLILRFFVRPKALEWAYGQGQDNFSIMPTFELTAPTATETALGGDALILSPAITLVADIPGDPPFGLGFVAAMNFIDFDVWKDDGRKSTTRYRGRIFWMQPLSKPGPNIFDGLYVLTEFQPIYDFMDGDFDFWVGPEFGKIVKEGLIVYGKPGWGVDPDAEDREFTLEFGVRIFY